MICTTTGCILLDGNNVDLPCMHIGKEHGGTHVFQAPDRDPVALILFCPSCNERHIDLPDAKPHRTHACQKCGTLWAVSVVPTVGVQFLPGCKDAGP